MTLSRAELEEAAWRLEAMRRNALSYYVPYEAQEVFFAKTKDHNENALLAGNQNGKTHSASRITAYHATGEYPDGWKGRRFSHPVDIWVACQSFELVRDVAQKYLAGSRGQWGFNSAIPKESFEGDPQMSRSVPGLIDVLRVKHVSGGVSTIRFKAYDQERTRFQGSKIDFVWLDEEPPMEIYKEILARTTATGGCIIMTMTPLLGMSEVVLQFYPEPDSSGRSVTMLGLKDAKHVDPYERKQKIDSYPRHEREARIEGHPKLGSGAIFGEIDIQSTVVVDPMPIPEYWPRLRGMDFGWGDHPTGLVQGAWDRDNDILYVTHSEKFADMIPAMHVSTMRSWEGALEVPIAWPHDGNRQWGDSGPLADVYKKEGANMLPTHATFVKGGISTEAGVNDTLVRMQTGRLKVFSTCQTLLFEMSTYHRKDGLLVKKNDDALSALFKLLMMLRRARPLNQGRKSSIPTKAVSDWDELDYTSSEEQAYYG